jgi:hypothetical protein
MMYWCPLYLILSRLEDDILHELHKGLSGKKIALVLKACLAKIRFLNFSILN